MVAGFQADVSGYAFTGDRYGALLRSTDAVIALARRKPDADYDGLSMEQVLSDAAGELETVDPDLAGDLDRAAATLD